MRKRWRRRLAGAARSRVGLDILDDHALALDCGSAAGGVLVIHNAEIVEEGLVKALLYDDLQGAGLLIVELDIAEVGPLECDRSCQRLLEQRLELGSS